MSAALPELHGKTPLTNAELQFVAEVAEQILVAAGKRSLVRLEPTETAMVRDQGFALFARVYSAVRRAVSYARWFEGDADDYAPSLYAGRGKRQRGMAVPETMLTGQRT